MPIIVCILFKCLAIINAYGTLLIKKHQFLTLTIHILGCFNGIDLPKVTIHVNTMPRELP